jgi:D-alanyl-D-alanine carboxypeptidase (penicillin-binding protein 5/6)
MKNTVYKNPEGLTTPGHTTTARDLSTLATRLVRDFPEEAKYYAIKKYRYPGTPSTNETNRNMLLFRDPTVDGLKTGHTTTARDLSILATRLVRDFPEEAKYYAIKKYRYPGTPSTNDTNRNLLLFRDPTVDGLKTGHTEAAGYCMIATAKRDFPNLTGGRRLLSIVLGASSETVRANESQKLLNWGYTAYDAVRLFEAGQPAATPAVWKGKANVLKLGRPEAIVVAVPTGSASKIKTQVSRPDPLVAPFTKYQAVGSLKVTLDDQPLADVPLVALEPVEQAGVFGRAWDAVRLWIK